MWCQCGRCGWSDTRWPTVGGRVNTGFALRGSPRATELALAARVERRSDASEPVWRRCRGPRYRKAVGAQVWHSLRTAYSSLSTVSGGATPPSLLGKGEKNHPEGWRCCLQTTGQIWPVAIRCSSLPVGHQWLQSFRAVGIKLRRHPFERAIFLPDSLFCTRSLLLCIGVVSTLP